MTESELIAKQIGDNFDDFIEQVQFVMDRIFFGGFADIYAEAYGRHPRAYDFELAGIDGSGITIKTEYNDSCHCHPEYHTDTHLIPWSLIKELVTDYEKTVEEVRARGKERAEALAKFAAEKKLADDIRKVEAQQARDLAEYKRLSEQFGVKP
jgi:hypothetical protein